MIKDNQKKFNRFHVLLDALVIIISYTLAWTIMYWENRILRPHWGILKAEVYFTALVIVVPLYLFLYMAFHLYAPKRVQGRRLEFANICKANIIGLMLITFVLFAARKNGYLYHFSTKMILAFFALNIVMQALERNAIRLFLRSMRSNGFNLKHLSLIHI